MSADKQVYKPLIYFHLLLNHSNNLTTNALRTLSSGMIFAYIDFPENFLGSELFYGTSKLLIYLLKIKGKGEHGFKSVKIRIKEV